MSSPGQGGVNVAPAMGDGTLAAPLDLPAPLTTEGGSTLDDGSGNMTVNGSISTSHTGYINVVAGSLINMNSIADYDNTGPPTFTHGIASTPPAVTTPAVPASGTAVTNSTGVDVMAYVAGGTLTGATEINGASTGLDNGGFYLAAGATITLTYSAAPTWTWLAV